MSGELFDTAFNSLEKGIVNAAKVQEVISHNIANANTPGYVPKRFDEVLNKAVDRQDERSVNLEKELADMGKVNIENSAYVKLLTSKLSWLRSIVTQGKK